MKRASRCRAALLVLGLILSLGPAVFAQRCSGDPEFCRLITSAVDYQSIVVRNFTTSAIRAENRGTYNIGQVFDIWEVVTGAWDYRHDVLPSDHFRSASTSISTYNRWRQFRGDCEDYATVLAACIRAIGGTVWLRFERDEAKRESHVYTMVYLGGQTGKRSSSPTSSTATPRPKRSGSCHTPMEAAG